MENPDSLSKAVENSRSLNSPGEAKSMDSAIAVARLKITGRVEARTSQSNDTTKTPLGVGGRRHLWTVPRKGCQGICLRPRGNNDCFESTCFVALVMMVTPAGVVTIVDLAANLGKARSTLLRLEFCQLDELSRRCDANTLWSAGLVQVLALHLPANHDL